MNFKELEISLYKDDVENFEYFLNESSVLGYFEVLFDENSKRDTKDFILKDNTIFKVFLNEEDIQNEIKILIYLETLEKDSSVSINIIDEKKYLESYKEYFKDLKIGNILIVPSWEISSKEKHSLEKIESKVLELRINPGLAFGTGRHETTQLIIQKLQEIDLEKKSILDAGCGSGILSIASFILGSSSLTCFDIDKNAVDATRFNFKLNHIPQKQFQLLEGGFDLDEIQGKQFDIVLANITLVVFKNNFSFLERLKSNEFLFSGIIKEDYNVFVSLAKDTLGGSLVDYKELDGWCMFHWKR